MAAYSSHSKEEQTSASAAILRQPYVHHCLSPLEHVASALLESVYLRQCEQWSRFRPQRVASYILFYTLLLYQTMFMNASFFLYILCYMLLLP